MLVTRKNIDTKKGGRIHHSSLVKGKPVKAAGMLFIQNEANGTQRITLNNESGHYKPTPQSLDKIIQWFDNHDLKFKILSDGIEDTYFGKVRTVVLEKQSGQISK